MAGARGAARRDRTGLRLLLPSLRANGSRECAPDDRLREAIHSDTSCKAGLLTWGWCVSISLLPYVCDPRSEPASTIWFACQIKLTFGRRSRRPHQDSACDG